MGTLYLVATPIGNLEDITLRAMRVLSEVDLIAAEDTRRTRQLLTHFDIQTPLTSFHEHTKPRKRKKILDALKQGNVALVSDAGTPGLNDPGFPLVGEALDAGFNVVPIPGPSAPIAALTASGLPTDAFVFFGYVPRKPGARSALFRSLKHEHRTAVGFEVPNRLQATLEALHGVVGSDRPIVLAREITKLHEQFIRGSLGEVLQEVRVQGVRGEYTLVIGGEMELERWSEEEVRQALSDELERGASRADAAKSIAALSGWTRKQVYAISLEDE